MEKQYKHLMEQQAVDTEVTAGFYEKLEKTGARRKTFRWKVALAVACIALMIPITVLAASNIFGKPKVKVGKLEYLPGRTGYSVRFDNLKAFPLTALSEKARSITKNAIVCYASREDVEKAIGIRFLNNPVLEDAGTLKKPASEYSNMYYTVYYDATGGKLYYIGVDSKFQRGHMNISVMSKLAVENSDLSEEAVSVLLGASYVPKDVINITHEEYTTKAGIPITVFTIRQGGTTNRTCYNAVFAVDNISYDIRFFSDKNRDETDREIVLEVLEGFVLD